MIDKGTASLLLVIWRMLFLVLSHSFQKDYPGSKVVLSISQSGSHAREMMDSSKKERMFCLAGFGTYSV